MINNNKNEFMTVVSMKSEDFRKRSFEACMQSFLKSVISKSTVVDVSNQLDLNDKTKMVDLVKSTISGVSKEIIEGSSLKDETNALYDVNVAGELENPQTLAEKAAKNISEAVKSEANDRESVLEAKYDSGEFKTLEPEQVVEKIDNSFESISFSKENNSVLSQKMKFLLSVEGEELVNSIKSDVLSLVNETEAKNSIVRDAISQINDRKDQIEEKINGDESEQSDKSEQKEENETSSSEQTDQNVEQNSSESLNKCRRAFKTKPVVTINDLIFITKSDMSHGLEDLTVDSEFDKISFSKEEAQTILDEFREDEDGIVLNEIEPTENTLSVSNDDSNKDSVDGEDVNDTESKSSENEYSDDNGEVIEVDSDKFNYGSDSNPEITPDEISEESLAKLILPLSLNKLKENNPVVNINKLTCFLASKEDRGAEFFNCINGRVNLIVNMMSKENIGDDDPINLKLKEAIETTNTVKEKVSDLTENLGILGILDGKFQRTGIEIDNAVKSLVNGTLLSKESLVENEYATIFKLALKLGDISSDISKGINVSGNREQLGDLEELLNEKIYNIQDEADRQDVESKVKALQSIEAMMPIDDVINMQVFVSKSNEPVEKLKLDSLKDIDGYGYCYCDEIEKIEKNLSDKYSEYLKKQNVINVDIHELVNYVAESKDTTKLDSNFYEQVIAKLVENKTIESSVEALMYRNKAKTMVTGFIAADKLGFMNELDIKIVKNDLF